MFKLHAELVGAVSYDNLRDVDFAFEAELEQDILDYIRTQLLAQFEKARHAADEGIKSAQQKLESEKEELNRGVQTAQANLDASFRTWEEKRRTVTRDAEKIIQEYLKEISK